jgi:hypothetical protein
MGTAITRTAISRTATTKATFTLDEAAVTSLQDAAERLGLSKSEVVREAILEFHARIGRMGERERISMLRAFDELVPQIPDRDTASVDQELAELGLARRAGGRR